MDQMIEEMLAEKLSIEAKTRIHEFANALERLFKLKIPLLKVDRELFSVVEDDNETIDPPLAVLFKRIGTGGTPLSDADYVYSVIKHRLPQSYKLVTELHEADNIASLLSSTDLVMTAVRLASAEFKASDKKPITDWESPKKQEFHRLIKYPNFLKDGFLPMIEPGALDTAFSSLTTLLQYDEHNNSCGLPSHAFPLLNRPLIQVLLRWIRGVQLNYPNDLNATLGQSREEILRFVMYWQLCVTDQRKASSIAYEHLIVATVRFPGKEIYIDLLKGQVAIPVCSPEMIMDIKRDVVISSDATRLRGWKRFDTLHASDDVKRVVSLYQRWWGNGRFVTLAAKRNGC